MKIHEELAALCNNRGKSSVQGVQTSYLGNESFKKLIMVQPPHIRVGHSNLGEYKEHFYLGRKVMTNLDSVFKSRDITLATKVCLVKTIVFPVVMYGYESWTLKKAKHPKN